MKLTAIVTIMFISNTTGESLQRVEEYMDPKIPFYTVEQCVNYYEETMEYAMKDIAEAISAKNVSWKFTVKCVENQTHKVSTGD